MRTSRFIAWCTFFLILLLVGGIMASRSTYRVRCVWIIPSGYRGWVLVEQGNANCSPGKFTLTSVTFSIDSSGHGCYSTPLPKASEFLSFWELDSQGRRHELHFGRPGVGGQIWEYSDGSLAQEREFFYATEFFVGTEAEYHDALKTRPKWWLEHRP